MRCTWFMVVALGACGNAHDGDSLRVPTTELVARARIALGDARVLCPATDAPGPTAGYAGRDGQLIALTCGGPNDKDFIVAFGEVHGDDVAIVAGTGESETTDLTFVRARGDDAMQTRHGERKSRSLCAMRR